MPLCRRAACLWLPLLASCAAVERREAVPFDAAISDLALCDVVFLGEDHDNSAGHRLHAEMLSAMHRLRPTLTLSMEMFERDVQSVLDEYLAGAITEPQLLEKARPWPHYAEHYRELVEFAKANGLPVLAANVPRDLARKVVAEGLAPAAGSPWAARQTSAPRDAYWRAFRAAMREHAGAETPDKIARMYQAQCLKDDTMAESIADHIASRAAAPPLVVHVCGKFHSDHGLGTVARLRARMPHLAIAVVGMEVDDHIRSARLETGGAAARYTVAAPPQPAGSDEAKPAAAPEPAEEGDAGDARPALGLMPDYDSTGGVGVQMVVEGGPAESGGILAGDVIIEVAGHAIEDVQGYMEVLGNLRIGETVEVVVVRGEAEQRVRVTVGRRAR
jgi:uncharacterized iron-regulated protein